MARKPKAKRPGRPKLAQGQRREVRSVRLPADLWHKIDTRGERTAVIERAVIEYLDKPVTQKGE